MGLIYNFCPWAMRAIDTDSHVSRGEEEHHGLITGNGDIWFGNDPYDAWHCDIRVSWYKPYSFKPV